jgi:hypothetical protein
MSVERVRTSLQRDFLLEPSEGFIHDVPYDRAAALTMAEHSDMVRDRFSDILCIDELHPGRYTPLLATDPLVDLPTAFALIAANDHGHMPRFLDTLKIWGLHTLVVVTDGSNLYPSRHIVCGVA